MAPKKNARLHWTFTTIALNSTYHQELADVSGTGLALGSLRNKVHEPLHEPEHVQTPYDVQTGHHQPQPAISACEKGGCRSMHWTPWHDGQSGVVSRHHQLQPGISACEQGACSSMH